ncbi:MAG TPA: hypothetical protein VE134_02390 [Methanomicrobiales archaeon]|nr:hypothetical protein [Methanomicrobiales archaeon]
MTQNYIEIISGRGESYEIYGDIVHAIEDLDEFPYLVEKICREALSLPSEALESLHFGLWRLQIHADIHRYQDMERAQRVKYVAQVLERLIFGSLMLEEENLGRQ